MKTQRLFEIVYLLTDRRTTTARVLADHFQVSVRTILRDIETLSSAGVPVYTSQGRGGGIHLLDRYVLDKTVLSVAEQNLVLAGLQALAATEAEAATTLSRLRSLFALDGVSWLEVDLSRWGAAASDRATFAVIREAIIGHRAIGFTYAGPHGEGHREACPLRLTFKSRAWYLQAACLPDGQLRTYKVTRMLDIVPLDRTFSAGDFASPTPTLESDVPETENRAGARGDAEDVRLRFAPTVRHRVLDEYDPGAVTSVDDGFLVTVRVPIDPWLHGHILSFGTDVEVLSPEHLRRSVARQAEAVHAMYSPGEHDRQMSG